LDDDASTENNNNNNTTNNNSNNNTETDQKQQQLNDGDSRRRTVRLFFFLFLPVVYALTTAYCLDGHTSAVATEIPRDLAARFFSRCIDVWKRVLSLINCVCRQYYYYYYYLQ
jgi:hypothetical protein